MPNLNTLVFVDTSVLLRDPDILTRIPDNGGYPVITKTVLDEIDHTKDNSKNEEAVKAARAFNRNIDHSKPHKMSVTPTGISLVGGDNITVLKYKDTAIYILEKMKFEVAEGRRVNNDLRIILTAKAYGGIVITTDNGWKTIGVSEGVEVHIWDGGVNNVRGNQENKSRRINHSDKQYTTRGSSNIKNGNEDSRSKNHIKFAVGTKAIPVGAALQIQYTPKINETVLGCDSGQQFTLLSEISRGGEGVIYSTQVTSHVVKIYLDKKLTQDKLDKISLIIKSKVNIKNVCFPVELLKNSKGEIVGYLMPKAEGKTLQSQIMTKPSLLRNFPKWEKSDVVKVCMRIVETIRELHNANVIIGDINPNNILLTKSGDVYFVDTDSFQIENYPCPVGTVNFTAPEIQGERFPEFLRTKENEIFAIATLIFMILMPGKPPYSRQNGEDQGTNIKNSKFPYAFSKNGENGEKINYPYDEAPEGPWRNIWSNLAYVIKEYFFSVFREQKRPSLEELIKALSNYHSMLLKGHTSNDIFPDTLKIMDAIEVPCIKCGKPHKTGEAYYKKMLSKGKKGSMCQDCINEIKAQKIFNQKGGELSSTSNNRPSSISSLGQQLGYPQYGTQAQRPLFTRAGNASGQHQHLASNQQSTYNSYPNKTKVNNAKSSSSLLDWVFNIFKGNKP
jgi:serine/threonine protein kinase